MTRNKSPCEFKKSKYTFVSSTVEEGIDNDRVAASGIVAVGEAIPVDVNEHEESVIRKRWMLFGGTSASFIFAVLLFWRSIASIIVI